MIEIILEKIINKLSNDNIIDLTPINEKTVVLSVDTLNLTLCFYTNNNQIFIFDDAREADVYIQVGLNAFWDLLQQNDIRKLIRTDKVVLQGDVKTAQLFVDILKHNNIKERLSSLVPTDILETTERVKKDLKNGTLTDSIIDVLIQPKVYK